MSLMRRAFGARDRAFSDANPALAKALTDLRVSEEDDPVAIDGAAVETPPPVQPAPEPAAQDHRERLAQLLQDARRIEQLLEQEAVDAALAENLRLDQKRAAAAKLAEAEEEAEAEARSLKQQTESAALRRAEIESELAAAQHAVTAAEGDVKRLEGRLAEAQNFLLRAKAKCAQSEGLAHEDTLRAEQDSMKIREAQARIAACRVAREAAEDEVREAETIARGIAQAAETLKQVRLNMGATSSLH